MKNDEYSFHIFNLVLFRIINKSIYLIFYWINIFLLKYTDGDWGLGIGDWGLGLGPIPNPQSPIPNPQSPIPNPQYKHI